MKLNAFKLNIEIETEAAEYNIGFAKCLLPRFHRFDSPYYILDKAYWSFCMLGFGITRYVKEITLTTVSEKEIEKYWADLKVDQAKRIAVWEKTGKKLRDFPYI